MGVLDDILNREFSIKYYGLNDLITGWHINKLIENESKIKEYFEKKESIIKTKDDFYDYLTLATIKRYQETVEYLKNDGEGDYYGCKWVAGTCYKGNR